LAKLTSFSQILKGHSSIYVDTNVLIYHLENRLPYSGFTEIFFEDMESNKIKGHTSALSILELNVKPYQLKRSDRAMTHIASSAPSKQDATCY
jgi:hypothetical protein